MPIVFSLVAFQKVVLAEDRIPIAAKPTATKISESLPRHDHKASYESGKFVFHCQVENEIVYICGSEGEYTSRQVYGYLNEIKGKFKEQFGGGKYPRSTDLTPKTCARFSATLAAETRVFNENPESDKMGKLRAQIDDVKQVMLQNIDDLIQRGDQIDHLVSSTGELQYEAAKFQTNATTLKRAMMMRNIKLAIALFLALCILGLIIAFVACGIDFGKCKSDSHASADAPTAIPTNTTVAPALSLLSGVARTSW